MVLHPDGWIAGFASYTSVEGPPTKEQQKYRDYLAESARRAKVKAERLRERIEARTRQFGVVDSKLTDLIVDLIHEESEY
jgi:hypothetical protein